MNTKITFVELVNLMAEATSTNKRVCELFLKDLFATVSQALIDGENVKVKGVGTFKITRVKPRKSVNVKTGEPMQIAGYSKLSFTPDKALSEAVNQPFAQFETVMLDDAVTDERLAEIDKQHPSTITEATTQETPAEVKPASKKQKPELEPEPVAVEPQIDEMDIPAAPLPFELPEMQDAAPAPTPDTLFELLPDNGPDPAVQPVKPDPVVKKPIEEKPVEKKNPVEAKPVEKKPVEIEPIEKKPVEAKPVEKKPVEEKKPQEAPRKDPMPERKPMLVGRPIDGPSQPVPEPEPEEQVANDRRFYRPEPRNVYTPTPEQIEEASQKPDRRWLWMLLSGLAVVLALWLMARACSEGQAEQQKQEVVLADTVVEDGDKPAEAKAEAKKAEKSEPKPEVKPEPKPEPKAEAKPEEKPEVKPELEKASTPAAKPEVTDVVTSQIVLTTLSEKHYGSPWFWVYIYEENVARGIINDPNNIKPGTRVVIPPASKYGINPKDKASLKKAQIKSMQYLKGK